MFDIKKELQKLPNLPGVYIMYNSENEIIYVGKSKSLKNRVRSYFVKNHTNKKVEALVSQIYRFEYIIVNNETESLVLEANLIKKNRPKYNINLKDDKQYPYIKISNEKFPKIMKVRELKNDKSNYFGPFPNVSDLDDLIELCIMIFKIRDCKLNFNSGKTLDRPCISYFLGRCDAPCIKNIDEDIYNKMVSNVIKFLSGSYIEIKTLLEEKMKEFSKKQEYEMAIKYRDYWYKIDGYFEKQIFNIKKFKEYHLVSYAYEKSILVVVIFVVNDGLVVDRRKFVVKDEIYESFEEGFSSIIRQFYAEKSNIVKEIYIDYNNESFLNEISNFISAINGKDVLVKYSQKGIKHDQMHILKKNAMEILNKNLSDKNLINHKYYDAILFLSNLLNNDNISRIESYDISNISGSLSVGSMVVFKNGFKSIKDYRKFRINTVEGPDDYSSHYEVLTRRFNRYLKSKIDNEDNGFNELPDIIFIDGGKGHVNIAKRVILENNLNIPVLGLVKNDKHKTKGIVYKDSIIDLDVNSNIYKFLYEIQEETHRFAITYHKNLRSKELSKSILDEIDGVGDIRKKNLLMHFGSISNIKKASIEEINRVDSIDKKTAEKIYTFFNSSKEN